MRPIYEAQFRVSINGDSDMNGFENVATAGFFEPGWNMNLLFHDIFEHWFENSKYFKTDSLSQAGECVALGIRTYFDSDCYNNLVQRFAMYNEHNGVEWNTWNVIIGQISENLPDSKDEDGNDYAENANQYPNDFNYTTLKGWNGENDFEGYVDSYNKYDAKIPDSLKEEIEKAVSYGFWLGEHLFSDKLNMIDNFCSNLKDFLDKTGIEKLDMYEDPTDLYDLAWKMLTVKVGKDNITADFCGVCISANKGEKAMNQTIQAFLNKHHYEHMTPEFEC